MPEDKRPALMNYSFRLAADHRPLGRAASVAAAKLSLAAAQSGRSGKAENGCEPTIERAPQSRRTLQSPCFYFNAVNGANLVLDKSDQMADHSVTAKT